MNAITGFIFERLASCTGVQRAEAQRDEAADEIQLNAFEFRNFRANMDPHQQKLVERVVNQWCAMLVKGKTMKVNNFEEKVGMDRNMLSIEYPQYSGEFYPLCKIRKMEMFKDEDDLSMNWPWGLSITFDGSVGEIDLIFNFEQERHRLHFALTLRILRTRDPQLDPSQPMEVIKEEDGELDKKTFGKMADTEHYSVDHSIPIVFSVSDLKIYTKLKSTSRHIYLEFFVKYPSQDKFLYAKSPTTHIPPQVLLAENIGLRKKKEKFSEEQEEEEKRKDELKQQQLGERVPLCAMRFELKNVKLKVPKVPHTIFGRLMAKDDYFPTAIGTFDFEVKKSMMQDRRFWDYSLKRMQVGAEVSKESAKEPTTLALKMMSAWKQPAKGRGEAEEFFHIGTLTLRVLGYIIHRESTLEKRKERLEKEAKKKQWMGDSDDSFDQDGFMDEEDGEEELREGDEEEVAEGDEEEEVEPGSSEEQ